MPKTDKEKIKAGKWVNCYLCESIFKRKRETKRYCVRCERGCCEGEHATFAQRPTCTCIVCGAR